MKNFRNSDYAVNKYSEGIVYQFSDKTMEITIEDYLCENPTRTKEDFMELKSLSDDIYLKQVRLETAQGNKLVSIHGMAEVESCATRPLDEIYCEDEERKSVMKAVSKLFLDGRLTEKQKQRFIQHYFLGKSLRTIAKEEGVFFTSVAECIKAATDKLKRYFERIND